MGTQMSDYSQFIFKSRYARWLENEQRRENWDETVDRYVNFFATRIPEANREETKNEIRNAIYNFEVMPSMRALMTAGPALERDNIAGYNCSYIAVDDPRAFDEAMYISMCGTGVGFSVERQFINQMPVVAEYFYPTNSVIKVKDSRIGWSSAFREMISLLYAGLVPKWDLSAIRPAGAPLKIFGGRASGPKPLDELFHFTVLTFKNAAGRRLNSIECHDLMCKVADVVVSGGVRRSAMISLSNLSDDRMRNAKNGQWWDENPQRALANNSAAYTEKPDMGIFMKEWQTLYESRSGERGIYNRVAAEQQAKRTNRRKYEGVQFGINPCAEIILRPQGLCNLTEVVLRPDDTFQTAKRKIRIAVIMGTLQSTLSDFRYLRKQWQKNADEERLLGVSLTGIMDNPIFSNKGGLEPLSTMLTVLKDYAIEVNKEWAEKLGINPAAAITCVKPSGTVSQLVDSSPGIHTRFGRYIVRAVRNDRKDPVGSFLKISGVLNEPDVTKPDATDVFYFPLKSPQESYTRDQLSAIEQLEIYKLYRTHWCEHNVSATIQVREHEWLDVAAWVYKNFNDVCGVTFLPYSNHIYNQAPYREVSEQEYTAMAQKMPKINWDKLLEFEVEDTRTPTGELACSAGACELV